MADNIAAYVETLASAAKAASKELGFASNEERQAAVRAMAAGLREHAGAIIRANEQDMTAAVEAGTADGLLDRLLLTPLRIEAMAEGLDALADLPDPVGRVIERRTIDCGLKLQKVSVPLGLVAMVYEARPNVTADAAGICIRTGNACVLRGGSLAQNSCVAIAHVLADAVEACGFSRDCVSIVETTDRAAADVLMSLRGVVDVLIPRGGAGLIRHCVENAKVPVIETGTGNCHIYVHESADFTKARAIVMNAKTQRVGVCNAAETLLVDEAIADEFLPEMLSELDAAGVLVHGDERTRDLADIVNFVDATDEDWAREYLAMELAVKCVSGEDEALEHIARYGTGHSEAIVAKNKAAIERFLHEVDASAVYANASTRFTDGAEFGLGAEIGISTQKLHARGPFAAEALTSYKYVIRGTGQVRP